MSGHKKNKTGLSPTMGMEPKPRQPPQPPQSISVQYGTERFTWQAVSVNCKIDGKSAT
ncbi:MAG: hypothetical protein WAK17_23225 [Candidatus Nitrosopolaris sp.]